jgi:hypothetical protein
MALGLKLNETRSWSTPYRGPLAIHAAKTREVLNDEDYVDDLLGNAGVIGPEETAVRSTDWPLGKIVAVVTLVDCVPTEEIRDGLSVRERAFGNYSDGRFAWITKDLRRIPNPIPFRGLQGLKPLPVDVVAAIETQFAAA